jgi:1-acyl-sn-glycerol-3-phosphate acyltransferase
MLVPASIPAVPCYLEGAFAAWPKGRWLPRPWRLHLRIGAPRTFAEIPADHAGYLHLTQDLRAAVQALAAESRPG